jgi:hypothetical protein
MSRQKPSEMTLKILFARSGNQCAFPGCNETLVNTDNAGDSQICHNEAAEKNGPRYNPDMTDRQRAQPENLLLLCSHHHKLIDNKENLAIYTVDALKKMKQEHETLVLNRQLSKTPTLLNKTINAIAEIDFDDFQEPPVNVFDIDEKLAFNHLKNKVAVIQEYKAYQHKLDAIYEELDGKGSNQKRKLLNAIHLIYVEVKGKYVRDSSTPLDIIRENADAIFDEVYEKLYEMANDNILSKEELMVPLTIVMVDAFMRCKILEEPGVNHAS